MNESKPLKRTTNDMTQDNQDRLSDEQAKELLNNLILGGFGTSGHRVFNGADYYRCSACGATSDTMGYAGSDCSLDEIEHDKDCGLLKLAKWASESDKKDQSQPKLGDFF